MKYRIIDNIIDGSQSSFLHELMFSRRFPWFLNKTISSNSLRKENNILICKEETSEIENQFVHIFFDSNGFKSPAIEFIAPLIEKINPSSLIKIKANMHWKTETKLKKGFHTDTGIDDHLTAIYYVNNNNGVTCFEDGTEIQSIKNRLLVFDSKTVHTGTTCTDDNFRCVINLNFFPSEKGINL